MMTNKVKQMLNRGQVALGGGAGLGSAVTPELIGMAGFDWVLTDNQHGSWDRYSSSLAFMSTRAGGAIPITRVQENDHYAIGRLLDEGALGIIVPMVNTRKDAEAAAFACRYPPLGGRSVGTAGAQAYGADYMEKANDEILCIIQLETKVSIQNAEAIMSVDGVDGCWLGPGDLALSLGHERNTPQHDAAVNKMIAACKKYGKAAGIAAGSVEQAKKWIDAGCTFISMGSDRGWIIGSARAEVEAMRYARRRKATVTATATSKAKAKGRSR